MVPSIGSIASRPWRALQRVLGTLGITAALAAGIAGTALPAAAAPATLVAKPKASKAKPEKSQAKAKTAKASHGKTTKVRATKAKAAKHKKVRRTASARRSTRRSERRPTDRAAAPRPSADLVTLPTVVLPDLALAAAPAGSGDGAFTLITRSASSLLDGLLARARSQLGTRYVYGATSPDDALDCSSFARYVMEALNVRLPRTANQQARVGTAVPRDLAALRPGDLLTFGSPRRTSHVGIYLGAGRFIHASVTSGQVIETTIERNRSLFRRWQGARRLLAGTADARADTAGVGEGSGG